MPICCYDMKSVGKERAVMNEVNDGELRWHAKPKGVVAVLADDGISERPM